MKPKGLFLNENLTRTRSRILFVFRQARRSHPNKIHSCGSSIGRVYVWEKSEATKSNSKIFIQSEDKLEKFLLGCVVAKIDDIFNKKQQLCYFSVLKWNMMRIVFYFEYVFYLVMCVYFLCLNVISLLKMFSVSSPFIWFTT